MSLPCSYCGVNAWTPCKHREAAPKPAPLPEPPEDGRTTRSAGGRYNLEKRTARPGGYTKFHQRKD